MFFSNEASATKEGTTRRQALEESSVAINKIVEAELRKNMPFINDLVPADQQEEFIKSLREDIQLKAIEIFKQKIKEAERLQHQQISLS